MSGVSAFLWQAALLLIVAYFLGAWIGCFLRRLLAGPPKVAMESDGAAAGISNTAAVAGAAGVSAAAAVAGARAQQASTERFSRALDGGETPPRAAPPPPKQVGSIASLNAAASERNKPAEQKPEPEPKNEATAPTEPATEAAAEPATVAQGSASGQETPTPPAVNPPETKPANLKPPMTAAEAAAVARAERLRLANERRASSPGPANSSKDAASPGPDLPLSAGTSGQAVVAAAITRAATAEPPAAPSEVAPVEAAATDMNVAAVAPVGVAAVAQDDDFTLISGVSADDAAVLRSAGVKNYGEIARWSAADVKQMSELIGDKRRIARQNWIEQAQLLHDGTGTAFAARTAAELAPTPAPVSTAPITDADHSESEPEPAAPVEASSRSSAGETAALAAAAAVAAAAVAAANAQTAQADGEAPDEAPGETERHDAEPASLSAVASAPVVASIATTSPATTARGDLQQIDGINAEVQKLLNQQGVTRVSQIADWSPDQQRRIDRLLGGIDRVQREDWVGQARRLSGYSEDRPAAEVTPRAVATEVEAEAPSRASEPEPSSQEAVADEPTRETAEVTAIAPSADVVDEPAARDVAQVTPAGEETAPTNVVPIGRNGGNNVRGLRSVRSEALAGNASATDRPDAGHDLKRIRGIGVLIEKRLRALGYTSYEQIGAWSQADIDKIGQKLDIPGRIQRENWIEQAKILSAGGQTEFSRRIDRGDS